MPELDDKRISWSLDGIETAVELARKANLTLLSVGVYLVVAALATSHRDLLLNKTFHLPIFGVDVDLIPFYVMAPVLLVATHVAALAASRNIAERTRQFIALCTAQGQEPVDLAAGLKTTSPIFDRILGGSRLSMVAAMSFAMLVGSVVLLPAAVLLLLLYRALPAQMGPVSLWQAALLIVDVVALWLFAPSFLARGATDPGGRSGSASACQTATTAFAALISVSVLVMTGFLLYDQQHQQTTMSRLALGGADLAEPAVVLDRPAIDDRLVALEHDPRSQDPLDFAVFAVSPMTGAPRLDLAGRSLRKADLNHARMVGADLDGADLSGANLAGADLRGASLRRAILDGADLERALLKGADLTGATFANADLTYARLDGTAIAGTNFTKADMTGAHLVLVRFDDPQGDEPPGPPVLLQASLNGAQIIALPIRGERGGAVDLRDANLTDALIFGVDIAKARVDGTILGDTVVLDSELPRVSAGALRTDFSPDEYTGECRSFDFAQIRYEAAQLASEETIVPIKHALRRLRDLKQRCLNGNARRMTDLLAIEPHPVASRQVPPATGQDSSVTVAGDQ